MTEESFQAISWPSVMPPALEAILGTICYQVIGVVNVYRAGGHVIAERAEAEQAIFIHRAIALWAIHGDAWREAIADELSAIVAGLKPGATGHV